MSPLYDPRFMAGFGFGAALVASLAFIAEGNAAAGAVCFAVCLIARVVWDVAVR